MTTSRRQYVSNRPSARAYAGANVSGWGRNQNLVEYKSGSKLGPVANMVVIVLLAVLLVGLYLTQLNKTGLQSLATLKNSNVAQAMTAPVSTDYAE